MVYGSEHMKDVNLQLPHTFEICSLSWSCLVCLNNFPKLCMDKSKFCSSSDSVGRAHVLVQTFSPGSFVCCQGSLFCQKRKQVPLQSAPVSITYWSYYELFWTTSLCITNFYQWNRLPRDVIEPQSLEVFKRNLALAAGYTVQ